MGPWNVSVWCDPIAIDRPMIDAKGLPIAITHPCPAVPLEECTANSYLIAAAPDMYETLFLTLKQIMLPYEKQSLHIAADLIREVLAKAEGKA